MLSFRYTKHTNKNVSDTTFKCFLLNEKHSEYYNIIIIEEHNKMLIEKDKTPGLRSCVFLMTLKFSVNGTLRIIQLFGVT